MFEVLLAEREAVLKATTSALFPNGGGVVASGGACGWFGVTVGVDCHTVLPPKRDFPATTRDASPTFSRDEFGFYRRRSVKILTQP